MRQFINRLLGRQQAAPVTTFAAPAPLPAPLPVSVLPSKPAKPMGLEMNVIDLIAIALPAQPGRDLRSVPAQEHASYFHDQRDNTPGKYASRLLTTWPAGSEGEFRINYGHQSAWTFRGNEKIPLYTPGIDLFGTIKDGVAYVQTKDFDYERTSFSRSSAPVPLVAMPVKAERLHQFYNWRAQASLYPCPEPQPEVMPQRVVTPEERARRDAALARFTQSMDNLRTGHKPA